MLRIDREVILKRQIQKIGVLCCTTIITLMMLFSVTAQTVTAATKTLSTPASVKAVSSSYNSITISWGGVSGASGYSVYRANSSNGTYTKIASTTKKSYKNTGLTTGRSYYYKIKAYYTSRKTKIYGKYSSIKSAKAIPSTPASVEAASSSYNSATINWGSVAGATGYKVYMASTETGTYSLVKTTTEESCDITELLTGSTYYFKVRAYRNVGSTKVYSKYSSVVNTMPILSVPTSLITESNSNDSIRVSWGEVEGAVGYEVYEATSMTGNYNLLATSSTTSYNVTGLNPGITYYFQVRAYIAVGSDTVYSDYSTAFEGKTTTDGVLSLNKTVDTLSLGMTDQLVATVSPSTVPNQSLIWESSDDSIVMVDNMGIITPIRAGMATITVATDDGSIKAECIVTVNTREIRGIDVSKWQGTIDWAAVMNAGYEFTMLRASYGTTMDPMYEMNYAAAKAQGIAVGAYHYSYATTIENANTEVEFLISELQGKQFEYPICIDLEDSSQSGLDKDTVTEIALVYLNKLKEAGFYPMIYSNVHWFTQKLDDTKLVSIDHWVAQWGSVLTYSGVPIGIWQNSSTGMVDGITTNVDTDISYVDYKALIKLLHMNGF